MQSDKNINITDDSSKDGLTKNNNINNESNNEQNQQSEILFCEIPLLENNSLFSDPLTIINNNSTQAIDINSSIENTNKLVTLNEIPKDSNLILENNLLDNSLSLDKQISSVEVQNESNSSLFLNELESDKPPTTFEQALKKIILLEQKLKIKEKEMADLQVQVEAVLSENSDLIETRDKLENELKVLNDKLNLANVQIEKLQNEVKNADKTIQFEHEKRRLHLMHVRELKRAIKQRDLRIKQLEESISNKFDSSTNLDNINNEIIRLNETIKKIQSEIYYKEMEIEKLNVELIETQNEILELKQINDNLKTEISTLKLDISFKDNTIAELNTTILELENKLKLLSEKHAEILNLDIDLNKFEELKVAYETKDYLEEKLSELVDENGDVKNDDEKLENKLLLSREDELKEIKEKFKVLLDERDKAIELLDKFEVEAKIKTNQLNELQGKYNNLLLKYEELEKSLKDKETELEELYAAFSSYKEESGFMSRENKILKEEKEALLNDIKNFKSKVIELEEQISNNNQLIEQIKSEYEEKINLLNNEKENAINTLKVEYEEIVKKEQEKLNMSLMQINDLKSEIENLTYKLNDMILNYNNLKNNTNGFLQNITNILENSLPDIQFNNPNVNIENVENMILVINFVDEDKFLSLKDVFDKLTNNYDFKVKILNFNQINDLELENILLQNPLACVYVVNNEKNIFDIIALKEKLTHAPAVLYSFETFPIHKISKSISQNLILEYVDSSMANNELENAILNVINERLSYVKKVLIKKDELEVKLRESVILTIENKMKNSKIESLNEQIEYLKNTNKKLKNTILEIQKLFDEVIVLISNLSLQELPQNISEIFNNITSILLKITTIKI